MSWRERAQGPDGGFTIGPLAADHQGVGQLVGNVLWVRPTNWVELASIKWVR